MKEIIKINEDKYIILYLPKVVNLETFSNLSETVFKKSKDLDRLPIILYIEDSVLNLRISDIVIFVNNNSVINSIDSKFTKFAIVSKNKNFKNILQMFEISLKNIGFSRVETFSDLEQAIQWIGNR